MNRIFFLSILFILLFGLSAQTSFAEDSADEWYEQGNAYFNESKYDEALEAYDKALQLNQNFTSAWIAKGITHQKLGEDELALDTLKTVIEIDPEDANGWFVFGSLYFELGKYSEAVDAFRNAVRIKPIYSEAWNYLGNSLFIQGLFADAADAYQKTLEIDPEHKNARDGINMTQEAIHNQAKGWKYIGDYLYGEGKFIDALNAYNQSLLYDPTYTAVQTNLNTTIGALQDPEKAMLSSAIFSLMFGDYDSALKGYEKVIRIYPNSSDAWSGMGMTLQKMKRFEASEHAYREAIKLEPEDDKIWKNLGDLLILTGKLNEARSTYEQALSLNPANMEVRELLEQKFNNTS
ncbi:lipopolysaccharide assembly protein LapB, partial [Methanospirillum hungatei]|uniref:tetratricopeptide repeat protein n=1 Tax=Methanospirillum hungatei TaxID=2203 RepID=UPI0026EA3BE5